MKWIKDEPDEPFYHSADGRFTISPLYCGKYRPQGWEVTDLVKNKTVRTYFGFKDAKEKALEMMKA